MWELEVIGEAVEVKPRHFRYNFTRQSLQVDQLIGSDYQEKEHRKTEAAIARPLGSSQIAI